MKKNLTNCTDCGDDSSILTQISSGPELIFLCSDCHNLKYLKEIQKKLFIMKKKKLKIKKLRKKNLIFTD